MQRLFSLPQHEIPSFLKIELESPAGDVVWPKLDAETICPGGEGLANQARPARPSWAGHSLTFCQRITAVTDNLKARGVEMPAEDELVRETLDRLIHELLDRHGTSRVLFRNTRASIEGFPRRELHQHLLPAPEIFAAHTVETTSADEGPEYLLMPEQLLGEDWLQLLTGMSLLR